MSRTPLVSRRTGLCPTMATPSLQRDGLLIRVALVGGRMTPAQAAVVAAVAGDLGSGVIEITNRGNVQIRGVDVGRFDEALDRLTEAGFGDETDRIVTISPFPSSIGTACRDAIVAAVRTVDTSGLSGKFVIHVADDGVTRPADLLVDPHADDASRTVESAVASIAACMAAGPDARRKDVDRADTSGRSGRAGSGSVPTGRIGATRVAAAAMFGRLSAPQLAAVARAAMAGAIDHVVVTPDRLIAVECASVEGARAMSAVMVDAGLLVDPDHPAIGVVACIGAAGCWQTELDVLAEARRVVADRPTASVVHVSGCEKSCAHRGPADVTFMGRDDSSGFDRIEQG